MLNAQWQVPNCMPSKVASPCSKLSSAILYSTKLISELLLNTKRSIYLEQFDVDFQINAIQITDCTYIP